MQFHILPSGKFIIYAGILEDYTDGSSNICCLTNNIITFHLGGSR